MSDGSLAHGVPPRGVPPGAGDILTLLVGNQALTGWQRVTVTRPLAAIPSSFDIEVTERYPGKPDVDVQPGAACQVKIGDDLVITGYVDRYTSALAAGNHTVRISGRSLSADLVDCSALIEGNTAQEGMQVLAGNTLGIVQKLAAQYNVPVQSTAGEGKPITGQLNINLGETSWEIIDRITRYSGMIAYDLPDGTLMLASVGAGQMASGFSIGDNVEGADVSLTMDGRFSDYEGALVSTAALGHDAWGTGEVIHDYGVPRFRKRYVVSEQFILGQPLANLRAQWECNRRYGQSFALNVTCDAWRDAAGKLWEPNYFATVQAGVLKVPSANWVIGGVTYLRDENGQHAQIILMPREAFEIEPISLDMLTLQQDIEQYNATKIVNPPVPSAGHFAPIGTAATKVK